MLTAAARAYLPRYQDNVGWTHVPYYYRITAVDMFGNESKKNDFVSADALSMTDATLPMYELQVAPQDLDTLNSDPLSDERVPGSFTFGGRTIPVEVRYRGGAGRTVPKKSWKIKFPGESPFSNQDRINVDAFWQDDSLIHSVLATRVFEAAGLRPAQAEHLLLALNGEYIGVYTRNEQVDEAFLTRTGRNPGASIYKVGDRFAELLPDEASYRAPYEKETNEGLPYTDLIAFIELINKTPDAGFPAAISAAMDVQKFLDYYAILVLVADGDSARHNIYLVHDLATDKWELVPWELEGAFYGGMEAPADMGTQEHSVYPGGWNMLRTSVLAVPEFRAYYCRRLSQYMDTIFSNDVMADPISSTFGSIKQDGPRDWCKLFWGTQYQVPGDAELADGLGRGAEGLPAWRDQDVLPRP